MFQQKNLTKSFKSPFNNPLKYSEIKGECNSAKEKSHLGQEGVCRITLNFTLQNNND